jgi:hypothetical protein
MHYTEEIIRMQQLAGIIAEEQEEVDPVAEKDAQTGLTQALSILKSGTKNLHRSPKDANLEESILAAAILGAPEVVSLLGKAVNTVSSVFQKDKKQGTAVGNALKKWGHQLEGQYVTAIASMLQTVFPSAYARQSLTDKNSALNKTAFQIYGLLIAAVAMKSGKLQVDDAIEIVDKLTNGYISSLPKSDLLQVITKLIG